MSKKQILILLVVFVAVLASVGVLFISGSGDWEQGELVKLIPDFRPTTVRKVVITDGGTKVTLVFDGTKWVIKEKGNYLLNRIKLTSLLDKIEDLEVVEWRADNEAVVAGLGLGKKAKPPQLTLYDAEGKRLYSLALGNTLFAVSSQQGSNPFGGGKVPKGRFVRFSGVRDRVALVDNPLAVKAKPTNWLDGQFMSVNKMKTIGVVRRNPGESWTLTRRSEKGLFRMLNAPEGVALNVALARDKVGTFFDKNVVDFKDVLPGDTADDITGFDKPESRVRIKTFADENFTLLVGDKFEGNYFVKILHISYTPAAAFLKKDKRARELVEIYNAYNKRFTKWVYRIPASVVEPVLLNRSQLLISTEKLLNKR